MENEQCLPCNDPSSCTSLTGLRPCWLEGIGWDGQGFADFSADSVQNLPSAMPALGVARKQVSSRGHRREQTWPRRLGPHQCSVFFASQLAACYSSVATVLNNKLPFGSGRASKTTHCGCDGSLARRDNCSLVCLCLFNCMADSL